MERCPGFVRLAQDNMLFAQIIHGTIQDLVCDSRYRKILLVARVISYLGDWFNRDIDNDRVWECIELHITQTCLGNRINPFTLEGILKARVDHTFGCFFEQCLAAIEALEDGARGLTGTEAGDLGLLRKAPCGTVEFFFYRGFVDFDCQLQYAARHALTCNLHRNNSMC